MEAILFCGIQATGKSSFYKEYFFKTHLRISLDQLNTRNKEAKLIETCFAIRQSFVVDNTNPTKLDRAAYITKAKAYKFKVVCYYFQSKIEDAMRRNSQRTDKERIPDSGVKATFNKLELPCMQEGFDELYYVEIAPEGGFIIKPWTNEI